MLLLGSAEYNYNIYEAVLNDDSPYLRMINFGMLNSQHLLLFQEVEEVVREVDLFLVGLRKGA
jgi:hypothetical protein